MYPNQGREQSDQWRGGGWQEGRGKRPYGGGSGSVVQGGSGSMDSNGMNRGRHNRSGRSVIVQGWMGTRVKG